MDRNHYFKAADPGRNGWLVGRSALWLLVNVAICCGGLLWQAPKAVAQNVEGEMVNREYQLKALFLYNFGGYIEWPADVFAKSDDSFVIGLLGSVPIDKTLKEIAATKKIDGRTIVIQQFASIDAIKPCQILFIARDVRAQQQAQVISQFKDHPMLIVGESPGFAGRGGSVNFFVEANKIRFEINVDTAKQHQLKISSKLLALAKIIQK